MPSKILDGILVQSQIEGTRELVAGMIRDPQFGPCVMFGLGGIFTQVLDDVSFRIARYGTRRPVRRTAPADRSVLSKALIALGRIGLENDQIEAIDVNPLCYREAAPP